MAYTVTTPTTYPYTAVVHITATYSDGTVSRGSGVIVGANDVLTAAHVVSSSTLGEPVSIKVVPARSEYIYTPYNIYTGKTLDYIAVDANGDGFLSVTDSSHDLAVIGFTETIGEDMGWFGINNAFTTGTTAITGYPAVSPYSGRGMIEDTGIATLDVVNGVLDLNHGLTATANTGISGGVIWQYDAQNLPYAVGVVSAVGWGTPLSGSNYDTVVGWINGNDWAKLNNTVTGGTFNDALQGTAGNDEMIGKSGNDIMEGLTGLDIIYGNKGADTIYGDGGDDTLYGGQQDDYIEGNQGFDLIYGNLANDIMGGQTGNDTIYGGQGADTILGGFGNDDLRGNRGDDILIGGDGADRLEGNFGTDYLFGDAGTDTAVFKGEAWQWLGVVDQAGGYILLSDATAETGKESIQVIADDVEILSFDDRDVAFARLFNGVDDFAGNTATTGVAPHGQYTNGIIDFDNDADWFAVSLVAGQSYYMATVGIPYPDIALHGGGGGLLVAGTGGELTYTAPVSGTFFVSVEDNAIDDPSPLFYQLWVS